MNLSFCNTGFIILILIIFSCNNEKDATKLVEKGAISLPFPLNCDPHSLTIKHYENDSDEFLFWYNKFENSILIYDLENTKIFKQLYFDREGPKAQLKEIQGISVFSLDSIFVYSGEPGVLYKIDTSGSILDQIEFANREDKRDANDRAMMNSKYANDILNYQKDSIIVPLRMPYFSTNPGTEVLDKISLFRVVNTIDGRTRDLSIHMSEEIYTPKGTLPYIKSSIRHMDHIYYSFEYDSRIHKYTLASNENAIYDLPSKYLDKVLPMSSATFPTPFEYYTRTFAYFSLFCDHYNGLFYRVCKLANHEKLHDYRQEFEHPSKFSIQVFNDNLEILDERLFDGDEFDMFGIFVGRKGLYISTYSPRNPNIEENSITFKIFTLSKS